MQVFRIHIDTPFGPMLALATDSALWALEFHRGERLTRLERRLARWFPPHTVCEGSNSVIERTRVWLARYFDGSSANADMLPLEMHGAPFEERVWAALREIPAGATRSYGEMARRVGEPRAARAVGAANGANPIAIVVPCHRVIGSNGSLTGYGGGLERKTWLLDHERRWRTDRLF